MRVLVFVFLVAMSMATTGRVVRAQTLTVLGDGLVAGALGPRGVEGHAYVQEMSYVAVSGDVPNTGLCVVVFGDATYEVRGHPDLRSATAVARNRRYLFATSPTHVHVLRFNATGAEWVRRDAVVHSPLVRLQPLGDSDAYFAFVREQETMSAHLLPTGVWERWEGGARVGSLGPATMFDLPTMGWLGVGLVATDASYTDVAGVQHTGLTPNTRVPWAGCRYTPGVGYPAPCDVDAWHVVDEEMVEVPRVDEVEQWVAGLYVPVATFSTPTWPGALTVLALQLSASTNASIPNVAWYLSHEVFPDTARLAEEAFSWVTGPDVTRNLRVGVGDHLTSVSLCNHLPTIDENSSYLDFNTVLFELDESGYVLVAYCGGHTVGAPGVQRVYAIEAGGRTPDTLATTTQPDWADVTITSAIISGDITAPLAGVPMTVSMSKPVVKYEMVYWRVCDESDCVRVEYEPDAWAHTEAPVVAIGTQVVGNWRRAAGAEVSPAFALGALAGQTMSLHAIADDGVEDPYVRVRCVFGPCAGDSFEVDLSRVTSLEAPVLTAAVPASFANTLGSSAADRVGAYVGKLTYQKGGEHTDGSTSFLVTDHTTALPAYTKAFSFVDSTDSLVEPSRWYAIATNAAGEPALLIHVRTDEPTRYRILNITGDVDADMTMAGLVLPNGVSVLGESTHVPVWSEDGILSQCDSTVAGDTVCAMLGNASIIFTRFDATNASAAGDDFFTFVHEYDFDSGIVVRWMKLDAEAGFVYAGLDRGAVFGTDAVLVWKVTDLLGDAPSFAFVVEVEAEWNGGWMQGAIGLGANHLFLPAAHGLRRYPVTNSGEVRTDMAAEYLALPGASAERDLRDATITCSRRDPLCVAAYQRELFVIVHAEHSTGEGRFDSFVNQHVLLPAERRVMPSASSHEGVPPVSFSPDGDTVAVITTRVPATDPDTGDAYAEWIELYQVNRKTGVLTHRVSHELEGALYSGLTWRPDSRSILLRYANDTLLDWTLFAMAPAPAPMAPSRYDMHNEFSLSFLAYDTCTYANLVITGDAAMATTLYFLDLVPDAATDMITFAFDPCMLDSTTSPQGTYAGIVGPSVQVGDVEVVLQCTTPTGQTSDSDALPISIECLARAQTKSLEFSDPFFIVMTTLVNYMVVVAGMFAAGKAWSMHKATKVATRGAYLDGPDEL